MAVNVERFIPGSSDKEYSSQEYRASVERLRKTYRREKVDHLFHREFYIWAEAIEKWQCEEGMPLDADFDKIFQFDPWPFVRFINVGWTEPSFLPTYDEEVLEVTDEYEICRDNAGRIVRYFKGQRHGFMPTYLQHSVNSKEDWVNDVKPRLDPADERRYNELYTDRAYQIGIMVQNGERLIDAEAIGGYMYLRALIGPEHVMYAFYDKPELVHDMMSVWRNLVIEAFTRTQDEVGPLFQLFLAEDICYNHGPLISPEMIREFLLPYYKEVYQTLASCQQEYLYFQLDTDGFSDPIILVYMEAGMDMLSPFEVAAGCDVVRTAKEYPGLIISGGIDKRILAQGKDAIDRELERIIPFFVERGGYIPTCDHGVPDNVSFENYLYYRQRICELD